MLALAALGTGCSDDQHPWCADLESIGDLTELAAAIAAGDASAARAQTDVVNEVAQGAPTEIRDDITDVAKVLEEAVEVSLAPTDAENLDNRREATNQRLADVPEKISTISAWAEEECGLRLD